jgi:hypothetical protein
MLMSIPDITRHMLRTLLALLVAVGFAGGIAAGQAPTTLKASGSPPSLRDPAIRSKHQARQGLAFPTCPAAGIPLAQSSPATGHHTVILSWTASAPSAKTPSPAVGYCLYRSNIDQDSLQKQPTCLRCQQVNTVPVAGTSCVDDLVANQSNYYYVVTAINAQGVPSLPSNEVSASIADDKPAGSAASGSPPPLCRAPAPAK